VADPRAQPSADRAARVMVVALALTWGLTWPAMKIALDEIPPFSRRAGTCVLGTLVVFAFALLHHRNVAISGRVARVHVLVAGCLNLAAFSMFTAFAQLATATSRVIIVTYTMPIWASLMARPVLGERLTGARLIALILCAAGLTVLIGPLIGSGDPPGFGFALATAVSWAAGTVYLKWARINADPIAVTAWQLVVATAVTGTGLWLVEGGPYLWPVSASALGADLFRRGRFRRLVSALVRDRAPSSCNHRVARGTQRSRRGHRRLDPDAGRATDACRLHRFCADLRRRHLRAHGAGRARLGRSFDRVRAAIARGRLVTIESRCLCRA
jgi:drug/metabolite transporter (DMT)-like permease